ncbi:MAG: nucleotidyltransferase domain-containing protein [Bacteriovoracia bacterium]
MNSSEKFGLKQKTIEAMNSVFSKYAQIESVIIYGSRSKGNYREGSDIDLTIKAPKLTTSDLLKIENELDDLMLPYKMDLSLFHQIENPDLLDHIQRVGTEFFKGPT